MNLVGLMLVRNEEWVLGASLHAALSWCDSVVIVDDDSTDNTRDYALDAGPTHYYRVPRTGAHWGEMGLRQLTLEMGRRIGGTHFAIIDADEILTANLKPSVRGHFEALRPGQCLDVPMIPTWQGLDVKADDVGGVITLGFADSPELCWKPRGAEGYEYHSRPPQGSAQDRHFPPVEGGVFHLQFADWERLLWKHRHYMLSEKVRWGYPDDEINSKYHWFLSRGNLLSAVPSGWWDGWIKDEIRLGDESAYKEAALALYRSKPEGTFDGLELFGWRP